MYIFVCYRTIELIALVAISSTLFLFLHTRDLHSRLKKMEVRLQPGEDDILSANQLSSGNVLKYMMIKLKHTTLKSLRLAFFLFMRVINETERCRKTLKKE